MQRVSCFSLLIFGSHLHSLMQQCWNVKWSLRDQQRSLLLSDFFSMILHGSEMWKMMKRKWRTPTRDACTLFFLSPCLNRSHVYGRRLYMCIYIYTEMLMSCLFPIPTKHFSFSSHVFKSYYEITHVSKWQISNLHRFSSPNMNAPPTICHIPTLLPTVAAVGADEISKPAQGVMDVETCNIHFFANLHEEFHLTRWVRPSTLGTKIFVFFSFAITTRRHFEPRVFVNSKWLPWDPTPSWLVDWSRRWKSTCVVGIIVNP